MLFECKHHQNELIKKAKEPHEETLIFTFLLAKSLLVFLREGSFFEILSMWHSLDIGMREAEKPWIYIHIFKYKVLALNRESAQFSWDS